MSGKGSSVLPEGGLGPELEVELLPDGLQLTPLVVVPHGATGKRAAFNSS